VLISAFIRNRVIIMNPVNLPSSLFLENFAVAWEGIPWEEVLGFPSDTC
jgi:hypothetical protein